MNKKKLILILSAILLTCALTSQTVFAAKNKNLKHAKHHTSLAVKSAAKKTTPNSVTAAPQNIATTASTVATPATTNAQTQAATTTTSAPTAVVPTAAAATPIAPATAATTTAPAATIVAPLTPVAANNNAATNAPSTALATPGSLTPIINSAPKITPNAAIPAAPEFNVKSYILLDAKSGAIIAAKDPEVQIAPASLTKLMALYLVCDALKSGRIKITDQVPISENAWRTGGSRMFAKVGSTIPLQDMINGIVIASGNDATVAVAEYLGGTENAFVDLMNKTAGALGMSETHFVDSNGLPNPAHYSSARDLAILARALINNFPEYYPWFSQKWITFNGIKQPNRNRLLWRDPSVDGIKTGHTDDAGFCLAASAVRNNMRLVAIVMGAKSDNARSDNSEALLNYGFRFFESNKLYNGNTALVAARTLYGKDKNTELGTDSDVYVTTPVGQEKNVKTFVQLLPNLKAPIKKGTLSGYLIIALNDKEIGRQPLVALKDNPEGGFFTKMADRISKMF